MINDSQRMINKVYEGLITTCLSMSDVPMRCKEIAKEISERSDFPQVTPQYVSRRMSHLVVCGEVGREEHFYFEGGKKRKVAVFGISGKDYRASGFEF